MEKITPPELNAPCISLIGMAGAGKSTIAGRLSAAMGWACMDTDKLIEALYAARLQDITDILGKEAFLDVECAMICTIRASRCIIATGGSVVYRPQAVRHLASLGPVVHLNLSLEKVMERIAMNPERGLAIAPGQTIADIYAERQTLYREAANIECDSGNNNPDECVRLILSALKKNKHLNFA